MSAKSDLKQNACLAEFLALMTCMKQAKVNGFFVIFLFISESAGYDMKLT